MFLSFLTVPSVAVVGLDKTLYQVSGNVGVVEVCAIVYSNESDCPIEFPFDVKFTTLDGSAGKKIVKHAYTYIHVCICFTVRHTRGHKEPVINQCSIFHELFQTFDLWFM